MKKKITNTLFLELLKLKIINKKKIIKLKYFTRDKKINVYQDKKSKVIFLKEFDNNNKGYKNRTHFESFKKLKLKVKNKKSKHNIKSFNLEDDKRRAIQHSNLLKNKKILDFGCGWGGFLKKLKNAKLLTGVELRKDCFYYIKKNIKKINILNNIDNLNQKYDIITMFHVLEHIPNQIETLKKLKEKLSKKGKIIIEVPHAEDFLLSLDEFKKFTFWSKHLVLHTKSSLRTILKFSGFKKIKIKYYQRYNFANHLGWFIKRIHGGQVFYKNIADNKINKDYFDYLVRKKTTDTLIAIASN